MALQPIAIESGSTVTVTQSANMVYYDIPGTFYTAQLAGGSTSETSNYFAIETYSAVDVSAADVNECGGIIMLASHI